MCLHAGESRFNTAEDELKLIEERIKKEEFYKTRKEKIKELRLQGISNSKIAEIFKISEKRAREIVRLALLESQKI